MLRKTIILVIIICFSLQGIPIPMLSAETDLQAVAVEDSALVKDVDFEVPQRMGTVKERYIPPFNVMSRPVVIIEDEHNSYQAQQHIADVLVYLDTHELISTVLVEGAEGMLSMDEYRAYPNEMVKDEAANYLIQKRIFSGAEKGALLAPSALVVKGMEQKEMYKQGFALLEKLYMRQEKIKSQLDELSAMITSERNRVFSKTMKECHALLYQSLDEQKIKKCITLYGTYADMVDANRLPHMRSMHHYVGEHSSLPSPDGYPLAKVKEEVRLLLFSVLYIEAKKDERHRETSAACVEIDKQFTTLKKALSLTLKGRETEELDLFNVDELFSRVLSISRRKGVLKSYQAYLTDAYKTVKEFYEISNTRSEQFLRTISQETSPFVQKMPVAILGAYHVEHITTQLKVMNVPFVHIVPHRDEQDSVLSHFSFMPLAMRSVSMPQSHLAFMKMINPLMDFEGVPQLILAEEMRARIHATLLAFGFRQEIANGIPAKDMFQSLIMRYVKKTKYTRVY